MEPNLPPQRRLFPRKWIHANFEGKESKFKPKKPSTFIQSIQKSLKLIEQQRMMTRARDHSSPEVFPKNLRSDRKSSTLSTERKVDLPKRRGAVLASDRSLEDPVEPRVPQFSNPTVREELNNQHQQSQKLRIDLSSLNPTENLLRINRPSPFDSNFHKYFSVSTAAKAKPLPEAYSQESSPPQFETRRPRKIQSKDRYRTLLNDLCLTDEKVVTKVVRERTPGRPFLPKNQTPFTISTHALSSSLSQRFGKPSQSLQSLRKKTLRPTLDPSLAYNSLLDLDTSTRMPEPPEPKAKKILLKFPSLRNKVSHTTLEGRGSPKREQPNHWTTHKKEAAQTEAFQSEKPKEEKRYDIRHQQSSFQARLKTERTSAEELESQMQFLRQSLENDIMTKEPPALEKWKSGESRYDPEVSRINKAVDEAWEDVVNQKFRIFNEESSSSPSRQKEEDPEEVPDNGVPEQSRRLPVPKQGFKMALTDTRKHSQVLGHQGKVIGLNVLRLPRCLQPSESEGTLQEKGTVFKQKSEFVSIGELMGQIKLEEDSNEYVRVPPSEDVLPLFQPFIQDVYRWGQNMRRHNERPDIDFSILDAPKSSRRSAIIQPRSLQREEARDARSLEPRFKTFKQDKPPLHMREFEKLFADENLDAYKRKEALKEKIYQQFGLSVLYRVKRLKNCQLSREQASAVIEQRVIQLRDAFSKIEKEKTQVKILASDYPINPKSTLENEKNPFKKKYSNGLIKMEYTPHDSFSIAKLQGPRIPEANASSITFSGISQRGDTRDQCFRNQVKPKFELEKRKEKKAKWDFESRNDNSTPMEAYHSYFLPKGGMQQKQAFNLNLRSASNLLAKKRQTSGLRPRRESQKNPLVDYAIGAQKYQSLPKLAPFMKEPEFFTQDASRPNKVVEDDRFETFDDIKMAVEASATHLSSFKITDYSDSLKSRSEHVIHFQLTDFKVNHNFAKAFAQAVKNVPAINADTQKPNRMYLHLERNELDDDSTISLLESLPSEQTRGIAIVGNSKISNFVFFFLGKMVSQERQVEMKSAEQTSEEDLPLPAPSTPELLPTPGTASPDSRSKSPSKVASSKPAPPKLESKLAKFKTDTKKKFEEKVAMFAKHITTHPKLTTIKALRLDGCGLADTGLRFLVEGGLKECLSLEYLNLSKNSITCHGVLNLILIFVKGAGVALKVLILHWNKIRGPGCISLMKALRIGASDLRELDLSFNPIGNCSVFVGKDKPADMDPVLAETFKFRKQVPFSIYKLGRFLAKTTCLQHLDLSFCSIEGKASIEFLSHQLKNFNRSILGLHIQKGNCQGIRGRPQIDTMGFLHYVDAPSASDVATMFGNRDSPDPNVKLPAQLAIASFSRIGLNHFVMDRPPPDKVDPNNVDNCWICGQWKQVSFEFEAPKNTKLDQPIRGQRPIYLNLRAEGEGLYSRLLEFPTEMFTMMKETKLAKPISLGGGQVQLKKYRHYKLTRMLPFHQAQISRRLQIMSHVGDEEVELEPEETEGGSMSSCGPSKKDKLIEGLNSRIANFSFWFEDLQGRKFVSAKFPKEKYYQPKNCPVKANKITVREIKDVDLLDLNEGDGGRLENRIINPRQPLIKPPSELPEKVAWSRENSVFKAFKEDTQSLMDLCFDFDWRCSKLEKLLSKLTDSRGVAGIYESLRQVYWKLKNVYRHYSAIQPAGGVLPCIGSNTITEVIFNCPGLLDRQNLNLSKVDLHFVSTNATKCQIKDLPVESKLNPDKFLVRYQFLEILVQLAKERYIGTKLPMEQQVEKLINENLKPLISKDKFDPQTFRNEKLWNEQCDNAIKSCLKQLKDVYKRYSGRFATPSDKVKYMSPVEFVELIDALGVTSDSKEKQAPKTQAKKVGSSGATSGRPSKVQDDSFVLSGKDKSTDDSFDRQATLLKGGGLFARDIPMIFFQSLMSRVDELSKDQHTKMSFVEFLDALARIVDKAAGQPEAAWLDNQVENQRELVEDMRYEARRTKQSDEDGYFSHARRKDESKLAELREKREKRELLAHRLIVITKRMAMFCMGQDYAQAYEREQAKKTEKKVAKELEQIFGLTTEEDELDEYDSEDD